MTGRFPSNNDPNLQNIPIRTPEGHACEAFVVRPGSFRSPETISSQIELRIMAHLSGDEAFAARLTDGQDAPCHGGRGVQPEPEQVSSEQRRYAKVINFGLILRHERLWPGQEPSTSRPKAAAAYIDRLFPAVTPASSATDETMQMAKAQ
ncbi:DNA polymerase, partial [Candidatus Skiveiella danica]|uniref:DNA polymerase n=1 Tax=Candidatus Skiveiella danica TaxID=3386177 RepID=UPI0039B88CAE